MALVLPAGDHRRGSYISWPSVIRMMNTPDSQLVLKGKLAEHALHGDASTQMRIKKAHTWPHVVCATKSNSEVGDMK